MEYWAYSIRIGMVPVFICIRSYMDYTVFTTTEFKIV